jgi:hypothetical protein
MSSHCDYDGYMDREKLREALDRAYNSGWRLKNIAAESGVAEESLFVLRHLALSA